MPNVTLTLKTDETGLARPEEMHAVLRRLLEAGLLPTTQVKLSFGVGNADDAEYLIEQLSEALEDRAWVIEAEIETKSKDNVRRVQTPPSRTPIERYIQQLDDDDGERNSLEGAGRQ